MKHNLTGPVLTVALALIFSSSVFAVDFNTLIQENSKAQNELHSKIQVTVKDSLIAAEQYKLKDQAPQVIVDTSTSETGITAKTDRSFLKFAKEKSQNKILPSETDRRLGQELGEVQ